MVAVDDESRGSGSKALEAMVDMARHVGALAGNMEQVNARLVEIVDSQHDVQATLEDTAVKVGKIEERLTHGDERFSKLEKRLANVEERLNSGSKPPPSGPFSKVEPYIKFTKEYGPWLVAGGLAAYGFIVALLKGANP